MAESSQPAFRIDRGFRQADRLLPEGPADDGELARVDAPYPHQSQLGVRPSDDHRRPSSETRFLRGPRRHRACHGAGLEHDRE